MLVKLRPGSVREAHDPDDPLATMLACHDRIRQHVASATRLAAAPRDVKPADVADAARAVRRYFTEALPLHAADEDLSLGPRLRAEASTPADVLRALDAMAAEHHAHESVLAELVAAWTELVESPTRLEPLRPILAAGAQALERAYADHLAIEESLVFPAARAHLAPDALRTLLAEVRARRAPP